MRARYPIALAAAAVLAAAAPARAHVQVTPTEAAPGDPVVFEVLVPGETDAHTTEVSLQIPKDVLPFSFEEVPGWKRTVEEGDDGSVSVVRWRGRMASDGFVRFGFLASTPEQAGELVWKAVQRYDDGEEAAWIGPPDSANPAPVTVVSEDAARVNAGGEGAEAEPGAGEEDAAPAPQPAAHVEAAADESDDGGGALAIVLGALGCALGLAALVVALRRRPA
jgi:uncharacterized protein YcnI